MQSPAAPPTTCPRPREAGPPSQAPRGSAVWIRRWTRPWRGARRAAAPGREVAAFEPAAEHDDHAVAEALDARRAASMLVAFESLTKRTPPISATGSSACSRPVKPSTALVIAAASTPTIEATADAASTSASRCRPSSFTAVSGTSDSSPSAVRRTIASRRRRRPLPGTRHREQQAVRARGGGELQRAGIVGVQHRPVGRLLLGKDPRLGGGVLVDGRVPVEVVGREVQQHRDPRPERLRALELEAARLDHVNRFVGEASTCALSARPMLPPTRTR